MKRNSRNCAGVAARSGLLAVALALSGCSAPSLLITPVSGRRDLVEAELMRDGLLARDKIALIDLSGIILNGPEPQLFGVGENPVSLLLEQLDKARRDRAVKAVILRINSPGGSVVASELMHQEVTHFRESGKPVVAVMMDVAASGGYYVACACDGIVAQPSTVTGSIGVVMQMVDLSGTLSYIGVKTDAITSGVHKDSGSPLRPMRPEERELFQTMVNDMYERFVRVVIAGRPNLAPDKVRALADGRVYTAGQALEQGLIDRVATLRETIAAIREQEGLRGVRVVAYHRAAEYKPNYYAGAPRGDVNLLNINLAGAQPWSTPQFLYLWQPGLP